MSTVIVDYGLGNLRSVEGAVRALGHDVVVSGDPSVIDRATRVIIPGVGAFGDGMANLHARGLVAALDRAALERKVPVLGICLGAQLMCRDSLEFGHHKGLGWIDASVVPIPTGTGLRVPHVGWNDMRHVKDSPLLADVPAEALFYYVHSFRIVTDTPEVTVGSCEYAAPFTAAFQKDNLYGTQFHPEKSQRDGLTLLRNFLERT